MYMKGKMVKNTINSCVDKEWTYYRSISISANKNL